MILLKIGIISFHVCWWMLNVTFILLNIINYMLSMYKLYENKIHNIESMINIYSITCALNYNSYVCEQTIRYKRHIHSLIQ